MSSVLHRRIEFDPLVRWMNRQFQSPGRLTWLIVIAGAIVRLVVYARHRDYWLDEGSLAGNIIGIPPFAPPETLAGAQLAPPGFLAVERSIASILGGSPDALRLFPLVVGIAALVGFRSVAIRALTGPAVPIAVATFALSDDLIYYSDELKPYIVDAAVGVGAIGVGLGVIGDRRRPWGRPVAAASGAIAPWFSFASGFLLPAVSLAWLASAIRRKDRRDLAWALGSGTLWASSGLGSLAVSRRMLGRSDVMLGAFWDFAFLPIPPRSPEEWAQLARHALNVFAGPGRVALPFGPAVSASLSLCLAVAGAVLLAMGGRKAFLALLLLPGAMNVVASGARLYPFHGRLILYLAPSLLLLIAVALGAIYGRLPSRWLRVALLVVVLVVPAFEALTHMSDPYLRAFDPHGDLRPDPF
ncbi:hypothetical protein [Tautonia plasticadhaerens]|uniref:Glycosyltransferase RgtA/B/C/D-like domain-containing protein n=1 Tax=Tautonia plasticadhaerens TaxID=2527974 RepID=A0A518GYV8_9BACT|nr:hypothetical protein [Tautonia plasticadhaerens]QDV33786.1 hypothetical protein ElP_16650 [Tautonia plasticadhaerens]